MRKPPGWGRAAREAETEEEREERRRLDAEATRAARETRAETGAFLIFSPNIFFWTWKNFRIYAHFMFSRK